MPTPETLAVVRPPMNRKRSFQQHEDEDGNATLHARSTNSPDVDAAPKRLRDPTGVAVPRPVLTCNAKALLHHLAFTRIHVTGNFINFNPSSSPILLCFVNDRVSLYHTLCQVLPPLYNVASTLQALAILTGSRPACTLAMPELLRVLPAVEMADLHDERVRHELDGFRRALPTRDDVVALLDPAGTCVWTSGEIAGPVDAGGEDAVVLFDALATALGHRGARGVGNDVMEEG